MNVPIVWVMGGPGSGKTTLAGSIVEKYGYKHLDINSMIDQELQKKSDKGKAFAAVLESGSQVPLNDIMPLLEKEIMGNKGGLKGFIVDGYPQNSSDAELLEQRIGSPDLVIALNVPQETMDLRKAADSPRSSITAKAYIKGAKPVLDQYASKTMQLDGNRDAKELFEEVVPNMEILNKNRGDKITITR